MTAPYRYPEIEHHEARHGDDAGYYWYDADGEEHGPYDSYDEALADADFETCEPTTGETPDEVAP